MSNPPTPPTKVRKYTLKPASRPQKQYRVRYEDELNSEQLEVVMAGEGPMLVIAGAGSGKTRTLTYRVSRLIEDGVNPDEILLFDFNFAATTNEVDPARDDIKGVIALVYTLVTRDTVDQTFAANRQLFLTEQGYRYTILDAATLLQSGLG